MPNADVVGTCQYLDIRGRKQPGSNQRTRADLVAASLEYPNEYCQYIDPDGTIVWACAGREIPEPRFVADREVGWNAFREKPLGR